MSTAAVTTVVLRRRHEGRESTYSISWCGWHPSAHTGRRTRLDVENRAAWVAMGGITVFLADDSVIIREGVRAMLKRDADVEVVGVAEDYDTLVAGAEALNPDVIVSDIRMPPHFEREGIDACQLIRKRHPGTGVVILSQYDDPDYAVALLSE